MAYMCHNIGLTSGFDYAIKMIVKWASFLDLIYYPNVRQKYDYTILKLCFGTLKKAFIYIVRNTKICFLILFLKVLFTKK